MRYVPLWTKSNFSFLEGASHPPELVERAHELGLPARALTDRDGVYGIVRAHVQAKQVGLRMIHGAQVSVGVTESEAEPVVLLATTRAGYGNLCRLLSLGRARCEKGKSLVHVDEVASLAGDLLALCPTPTWMPVLHEAFADRLYALAARHRSDRDPAHETLLRQAAAKVDARVVAAVEVLYHRADRRPLQDVLT